MLTLFRRIRRELMAGHQTRTYVFYAIGEILLVMIGILLALQVNNWNEFRKERIKEREILQELTNNINTNITFLNEQIAFEKKWTRDYNVMIDVIANQREWHDSLQMSVRSALWSRVPTISFSAYESLKLTGLDVISSGAVRQSIVDLYEGHYRDLVTIMTRIVNIELKPQVTEYVVHNMKRVVDSNRTVRFMPINSNILLTDPQYTNLLAYAQGYRQGLFDELLTKTLIKSKEVLNAIEMELSK